MRRRGTAVSIDSLALREEVRCGCGGVLVCSLIVLFNFGHYYFFPFLVYFSKWHVTMRCRQG